MSYKALMNDIKNNNIKKLCIVFGEETYLIDRAWENLKKAVVTDFPELNFTQLDGEHMRAEQLASACETFPFGCERRLVAVRDFNLLKSSGRTEEGREEGQSSSNVQEYMDIVGQLPETTCLVFISYGNIDKRKKLFTEIKKNGSVYEFARIEREDLYTWIRNVLGKHDKKIGPRELDYLVHISGYADKNSPKTLYDVENMLIKLAFFMDRETNVQMAHIEAVMPKNVERDIFKLINACSEKKISDSLKIYGDQLLEGESSLGVLAMVTKQIKNIMGVAELRARGYDSKAISDSLKLHEYTVKLCLKYGNTFNAEKLHAAFNRCLDTENSIKSGRMAERLAMEMLLVNLFE